MNKNALLRYGSYVVIFGGFLLMFFLCVPSFDVFFFSRDYEPTLQSFWENSLFYGNGRLLGNLLGISFSHNFIFAFLLISVFLILIVALINILVFNNDYRTIFPIAFVIAFPCKGIFSEVYSVYASFTNYVLPVVFLLSVWCLLKKQKNRFVFIPVFLFSILACLFSENSTIVVLIASICYIVYSLSTKKKVSLAGISFLIGSITGTLGMYLIPKLTNTSEKLSFYREIKTELISLIKSVISVSFSFSNMFTTFIIPILLCSSSFAFLILKQTGIKKAPKTLLIGYLLFFAAESFVLAIFSDDSFLSIYFAALQTIMVAIYAVVIFICLLCLKKSAFRLILIELYILILFSIGPLLIVSKYGYRTFYLTFILLFVFACYLLKEVAKHLSPYLTKDLKVTFKKVVPVVFATAFVFLSMNIFIQTSYNYNFYVVRTQYIAEQVNMDAETIYIPTLPCKTIVCEDEHPSSLSDIIYKTSAKSRIAEQNMVYCKNIDSYNAVLSNNPVSSILYSFSNLQYKSPHTIFSLIQNN